MIDMTKSPMLGLDIGSNALKWVQAQRGAAAKCGKSVLPENLVYENGRIVSQELLAQSLRDSLRQSRVSTRACAAVLPADTVIVRRILMPYMQPEQLDVNLPYEFHDFIQDEKDAYFYDYTVVNVRKDDAGENTELELLAAAVRRDVIAGYRSMLKKAGLVLKTAIPACIAYGNLLRSRAKDETPDGECCVVDLGYSSIQMYIYRGGVFETARTIECGGKTLDTIIAEAAAVDPHIAGEYKNSNYTAAQELPQCRELYAHVATEIMRAVNFYGFNTPDSDLKTIYLTGGLSHIKEMTSEIRRMVNLDVRELSEIFQKKHTIDPLCAAALGALEEDAAPARRRMNLAKREKPRQKPLPLILTAFFLTLAIGAFCKLGVVDLLREANAAEYAADRMETRLAAVREETARYPDVYEEYQNYKLSAGSMTGGLDPMACLDLIQTDLVDRADVEVYAVSDALITVRLSGVTLQETSAIYADLMASDLVENVQVYTAFTGEDGSERVTATMTIQLAGADQKKEAAKK